MKLIGDIRLSIKNGNVRNALDQLITLCKKNQKKELLNEAYLLSSQYQIYIKNKNLGLLKDDSKINNIVFSVLTIIGNIEDSRKSKTGKAKNQQRRKGRIVKYFTKEKYGFINSHKFNKQIFFHISSLPNKSNPKIGNNVTFVLKKNKKGFYAEKLVILKRKKKVNDPNKKELTFSIDNNIYSFFQNVIKEIRILVVKLIKSIT